MRAVHGTAIYTGGGIYNIIGKTDNGLWFFADNDYLAIVNTDIRETCEDGLACYYDRWLEEHEVDVSDEEKHKMLRDFCRRLDADEKGLTEGYEGVSNYMAGEVETYICSGISDENL